MKKKLWLTLMIGLSVIFTAASACAEELDTSACEEEQMDISAFAGGWLDASAYVETLCSGDADSLIVSYSHTDELVNALKQSGGLSGLQASLKVFGKLKETGEPIISEVMGYTSYSVPCVFEVQKINLVLNVDQTGKIAGIVTAPYMEGENSEKEDVTEAGNYTEVDISIPVEGKDGWELPGTLTLPMGDGPFPAIVLVHGSGPNDRDETLGANKPFRDIAEGLAAQGIAVYRYDKRTYVYGQEMAADTSLTLAEETIQDAVSAVKLLARQENIDPGKIFVAGHSLGGQAIPAIHAALTDQADAAGYIFLAAPARKLSMLMREQYDFLYSLMPELTEEQKVQKDAAYVELDKLNDPEKLKDEEVVMGAYGIYWKNLEQYDQVVEAAVISVPCLVLQGEEDYQVTMEDYEIWEETYAKQENWQFKSYAGLTHLFMPGEKMNGPADYQAEQHVDEQMISDMAEFVLGIF